MQDKIKTFPSKDKFGDCRWIGYYILPHSNILKFEITLLEAEKKIQMLIISLKLFLK